MVQRPQTFYVRGDTIERRDETGFRPIALCQSAETAADIVNAFAARDALCELLRCSAIPDSWASRARETIQQRSRVPA